MGLGGAKMYEVENHHMEGRRQTKNRGYFDWGTIP